MILSRNSKYSSPNFECSFSTPSLFAFPYSARFGIYQLLNPQPRLAPTLTPPMFQKIALFLLYELLHQAVISALKEEADNSLTTPRLRLS